MSEYRITSTMNQEIPVIGEIPQNKFHSFSCLAICQNCGLVVTKSDQKVECYPCFCCTFCFFCFIIRQCKSENYITCCNTIHICPKCGHKLGDYQPC